MSNPGSDRDQAPSSSSEDEADDLALPHLDLDLDQEESEGLDDEAPLGITDFSHEADAMDDSYADDIPIDVSIDTGETEESALDDDAQGLDDAGAEAVAFTGEAEESFLDDQGHAEEGIDFEGSEALGIDPIPREEDDGGLEGLDDPGDKIDQALFPPLDTSEEDDEELDLDIPLAPPPPLDRE